MIKKWQKLPPAERLKYQISMICFIIAGYTMIYLFFTHTPYFESKKMLHRKLNRIEVHGKVGEIDDSGMNPKVVEKKIARIDEEIAGMFGSENELDTGFAPVDSTDVHQQLMLEISTLAERTGVSLVSVERKGFRADEEMTFAPLDKELGRPLLVITANTEFMPLLDFLKGLKDISFYVSVMNLKVYSRHMKKMRNGRRGESREYLPPGAMFAQLEVSM